MLLLMLHFNFNIDDGKYKEKRKVPFN